MPESDYGVRFTEDVEIIVLTETNRNQRKKLKWERVRSIKNALTYTKIQFFVLNEDICMEKFQ